MGTNRGGSLGTLTPLALHPREPFPGLSVEPPQLLHNGAAGRFGREKEAMSKTGMSVEEAKAYLAKRGLESLVPGGFKTLSAMQQGGGRKQSTKRKTK